MTSLTRDESLEAGEPIYLYTFARGTSVWRYTNIDRDRLYAGDTYTSAAISHSTIRSTSNTEGSDISITFPRDLPVAANWYPWPPSDIIYCTIKVVHEGETDAISVWSVGRIIQPKFTDNELTVVSEPPTTTGRTTAPSLRLQRTCWKTVFGPDCKVNPEKYRVNSTLTAINGFTLTIPGAASFPNGRLVNGVVEWTRADGLLMSRTIEQHVGTLVTIDYGDLSLVAAMNLSLLPGCKQTYDDCELYFANTQNCGALVYIPTRNPYDGNPVR